MYSFEIENGQTPLEVVNVECATLAATHSEALRLTGESIADFTPDFWLHPIWSLRVFDEARKEILKLDFFGKSLTRSK